MNAYIEQIKRIVAQVLNTRAQPRWGFVRNVRAIGSQVQVRMETQPEGVLTGWLPVLATAAGATGAAITVPMVGWQGFIAPDLGEAEHGVVLGFTHSDMAPLPGIPNAPGTGGTPNTAAAPLQAGETVMVAFGSTLRLNANGDILAHPGSGTFKVDGHMTVNGNITAELTITAKLDVVAVRNIIDLNGIGGGGTLAALRTSYDIHLHLNSGGSGLSGLTNAPV